MSASTATPTAQSRAFYDEFGQDQWYLSPMSCTPRRLPAWGPHEKILGATEMRLSDGEKNYYVVLGASEDASQAEIERLYKRLAKRHHPDRGGSAEKMKAVN